MATSSQPQRTTTVSDTVNDNLNVLLQPRPQVFVNFRGAEIRNGFLSHVVKALKEVGINVFIDSSELRGVDTSNRLLARIDNSKVALAIFSSKYTESDWCLKELVRMDDRMKEGKLLVIPIFYKVTTEEVKNFEGEFGEHFRDLVRARFRNLDDPMAQRWMMAVTSIASKMGLTSQVHPIDSQLVEEIVKASSRQLGHSSSRNPSNVDQFGLEILVVFFVAVFCGCFIPSAFTHVRIFTPQWFLIYTFSFGVRKAIYRLLS